MATMQMDQAMADTMVEKAIGFCADKKFNGDLDQTLLALRRGRCDACDFLSFSLVRQIGEYLGNLDRTVKAVYVFKPEKTQVIQVGSTVTAGRKASGINLIAWVDRKNAALSSIRDTLEKALTASRRRIGCVNATPACSNLDIYMVDDIDVAEGRGYGAIVQSMYVRSIQVWTRIHQFDQTLIELQAPAKKDLEDLVTSFNPEIAPEETLFEQALAIECMPAEAKAALEHRLREEKVVLIRRIISDQLAYINIAKEWFSVSDLIKIRRRKIGYGKIGGKAAGLLLAASILNKAGDEILKNRLQIPESYFIGSDLIYIYMSANGLSHWNDQKYKPEEQIRAEYPRILEEFKAGEFPPDILEKLQDLLDEIGLAPVIVRSSSQLEDNFGTSFAGKYDSYFCPNQASRRENLRALTQAISLTYASTLKPAALLYRRSKGLQDYDERMAILIQVVQGEKFGRYFLPHGAGVAFSRNLYRWSPEIRKEAGFTRLVWGLGTRAVERVGNDYPRLVALSHPNLHPDDSTEAIRHYSQQYVDLIDLEENKFVTLPITEILKPDYPSLRYLAQLEVDGFFAPIRARISPSDVPHLAITFSELIKRTPYADTLFNILRILEQHYHSAVDLEYTLRVPDPYSLKPDIELTLLQCRPQSHMQATQIICLPQDLKSDKIIFATHFMVPQGYIPNIRYIVYIPPNEYYSIPSAAERNELGRIIGKLNSVLDGKTFICVGPGRWGTTNTDLGVYVNYSDIFNAAALIELSGQGIGPAPDPSFGTHFFQDLMEAEIFPLAVFLDRTDTTYNHDFFDQAEDCLGKLLPSLNTPVRGLRVIDVSASRPGCHIELVMDDEKNQAIAYLSDDQK